MSAMDGDRFGSRAADYAHHRADFPAAAVDRLVGHGVGRPGQRLLDLGCGTGTLARQFAARGCVVTGLDVDGRMLEAAEALAARVQMWAQVWVRALERRPAWARAMPARRSLPYRAALAR